MSTTSDNTANAVEAKVQLVPVPIASPGKCVGCGKYEHPKGFAWPQLDFEFYGTLYICGDCVADYAALFGFIPPEQAILLARRIMELEQENDLLKASLENLESAVEHLTNYRMLRNTTSDTGNSSSVSSTTDETPAITDEAPGGEVVNFPGVVTTTESEPSELISEQGSDDVSVDPSSNSTIPILDL
jgi:hypothetical protein